MKAARLIQPYDARIESIALVEPSQSLTQNPKTKPI